MPSAKQIAARKRFVRLYAKKGKRKSSSAKKSNPPKTLDEKIGYKDKNPTETHSYYYILYLKGTKGGKIGKSRVSKEYKKKADAIARAKKLQNGFSVVKVYGKDKNEHIFREIGEVNLQGNFS